MSKMEKAPWYLKEQNVAKYEDYYQHKYRRADLLEKRILKTSLEQFAGAETILEVGCGTGHFTRWMESLGLECQGLDVSILMLEQAKKLWIGGRLLQGESGHLPFGAKSFDIVTYITSLEYMHNVALVLSEAGRVAKKGIIFGLMNKWSTQTMRRIFQAKLQCNSHYTEARFYSIRDIRRLLCENFCNYSIVYWNTTVFPRFLGNTQSAILPFGSFLCLAVKLVENDE